jgi:CrcB protein
VSAALWITVAALGGLGAIARFSLGRLVNSRVGGNFPAGTLAVNASGAFLLGLLVGTSLEGDAYLLAGTAFLGSYTTFSTWMLETHRLAEEGETGASIVNVVLSAGVGLGGAALGRVISGAL